MRDLLSTVVGLAAGAAAMYYLDPEMGRRRRALVKDKFVSVSHDVGNVAGAKRKRLSDRVKGALASVRAQLTGAAQPRNDRQLCDRIRAQLGRVVSHPRAIEVHVTAGQVRLRGDVLRQEVDELLSMVSAMRGVHAVDNQLSVHETGDGISRLQGAGHPRRGMQAGRRPVLPIVALAAPVAMAFLAARRGHRHAHHGQGMMY